MTWSGLEPGTAPANDPAICGPGAPDGPAPVQPGRASTATCSACGRPWTCWGGSTSTRSWTCTRTCTTRCSTARAPRSGPCAPTACRAWTCRGVGRSSTPPRPPASPSSHFWANNVRGDLQGEYDRVWGDVARAFRGEPVGPRLRPLQRAVLHVAGPSSGTSTSTPQLECFYTGTAHIGAPSHGAPPLRCPPADPANGVVPTILANDPSHLIFDEPDNFANRGFPTYLGPMNLPNLVFNVHLYCGARSPVTGNPTNLTACARQEAHSLRRAGRGPAGDGLRRPTRRAGLVRDRVRCDQRPARSSRPSRRTWTREQVGWVYWSWKYYGDPTGSDAESLVHGRRASALDRARAQPRLSAGGGRRARSHTTSLRRPACSTWPTSPTTASTRPR